MSLTKEYFDNFIARLKFHNLGEGVDDHCTANPIFIVEKLTRHIGIDLEFDPSTLWSDCPEHESEYETLDELKEAISEYVEENGPIDEFDPDYDDEVKAGGETIFKKVGYFDTWDYVCAHFTKEAAEAFIARKKHDYMKLRVFVDCQFHCWEFNAIVKGLLDGEIVFKDQSQSILQRANAWSVGSDSGSSSKTIWAVMMGLSPLEFHWSVPYDPADFGRCYRLLQLIPEWETRLSELGDALRPWKPLVERWQELKALYEEKELPLVSSPKLYALMKELREVTV